MPYYSIDTLGDLQDRQLCVLDDVPEGIGVKYSRLVKGRSMDGEFPASAIIRMSADRTGIKLSSLIGNTNRLLILHRDVKELIETENAQRGSNAPIEYWPFTLINHKDRPHSSDYFILNPVGPRDCLNMKASVIRYFRDTEMVSKIERMVIDPNKLLDAPPLFRLKQAPDRYFVDGAVALAFEKAKFTNLTLRHIETQPEDSPP